MKNNWVQSPADTLRECANKLESGAYGVGEHKVCVIVLSEYANGLFNINTQAPEMNRRELIALIELVKQQQIRAILGQ